MDKYTKVLITSSIKRLMSLRELESRNAEDPIKYKEEFDVCLVRKSKHWMREYSTMSPLSIILDIIADSNTAKKASEELEGLVNRQGEEQWKSRD